MMARILPGLMEKGSVALEERIREDAESGKTEIVLPIEKNQFDISQVVKSSLDPESST
jgi:hypothetical protein